MNFQHPNSLWFSILTVLVPVLFFVNLWFGSILIPWETVLHVMLGTTGNTEVNKIIVLQYRLPQALTASATGIALSVSGLILQTLFRNPLAGPSVLGISSGASFGVALVVLTGGVLGLNFLHTAFFGEAGIVAAAFVGALFVLGIIIFVSRRIANIVTVLIIGIMIGYAVSAFVSILQFFSRASNLQAYVLWGLGSFSQTDLNQALGLFTVVLLGVFWSGFYIRALNALLPGEAYARSIGFNVRKIQNIFFVLTGLLIAVTTAYTGPIGFLGLAVPHLARTMFNTSNHRILLPAVVLTGAGLALACNFVAKLPGYDISLPINAVTSLIGAPVVIWVIVKNRHIKRT